MGLPSQDLPILLVTLLPHRCTIACEHLIPSPFGRGMNFNLSNMRKLEIRVRVPSAVSLLHTGFRFFGSCGAQDYCPCAPTSPRSAACTSSPAQRRSALALRTGFRFHFCGTIRQLTLPGVSPDVCSWMHGLSSPLPLIRRKESFIGEWRDYPITLFYFQFSNLF